MFLYLISAIPKPADDVVMCDEVRCPGNGVIEFLSGARLHALEPFLELVPEQFDGIEVRRVGWKEEDMSTGGTDTLQDVRGLVRTLIVHDDDVARIEFGDKQVLDEGFEDIGRRGSFDGHHRPNAVQRQSAQHGGDDAAVPGDVSHHALASGSTSVSARHARVAAGFVEENEPSWVEQEHQEEEDTPHGLDPRRALLRSYKRLFLSLSPWRRRARQTAEELVCTCVRATNASKCSRTVASGRIRT